MPDLVAAPAASETTETLSPPTTTEPSESTERTTPEQRSAWMNRALRGGRGGTVQASRETSAATSQPAPSDGAASEGGATKPEDFERAVQAEVDRRSAKANREAAAKAKVEADRRLAVANPQEFARQKLAEQEQQSTAAQDSERLRGVADTLLTSYDKAVLDPIFGALSKADQNAVLREHGHLSGVDNRAAVTKSALQRLEKQWKAEGAKEAEAKLRSNPAFSKQLKSELRGEIEEPEVVSGGRAVDTGFSMNDWMRAATGRRHAVR